MKRTLALIGILGVVALLTGCATMKCGTPMTDAPAAMSVDQLMAKKAEMTNKPVCVKGVITAVCTGEPYFEMGKNASAKGDDAILVAMVCPECKCSTPACWKGKTATVQGKLVMTELTVEQQKHEAEKKGESKDDIAKIKAPKKVAKIEACFAEVPKCCPLMGCKACAECSKCCKDGKCSKDAKGCSATCTDPKAKESGKCPMEKKDDAKAQPAERDKK